MSYNPTNWVNGQTPINDSNLNHIEQGIKAVSDLSDAQEIKIANIANNQIPEAYLQQSVDNYIANNQAGIATKTDVNNLDSKLSSEIAYQEYDGYLSGGVVKPQGESKEKYTSKIPCVYGDIVGFSISHTIDRYMWVCYELYNGDTLIGNREYIVNMELGRYHNVKIPITNKDITSIAFTYRSYNDAKINIIYIANTNKLPFEMWNNVTKRTLDNISYSQCIVPSMNSKISFSVTNMELSITVPNRTFLFGRTENVTEAFMAIDLQSDTTYVLPVNHLLCYDTTAKNYVVITQQEFAINTNKYVLCVWNHYGNIKGQWYVYYLESLISSNKITNVSSDESIGVEITSRQGEVINGTTANTLTGIKLAKKYGYNHIRLSVCWTSDGVAVLSHDATVTVDETEYTIKNTPFETLSSVLPTLEDGATLCKMLRMKLDIELKFGITNDNLLSTWNIIAKLGMTHYTLWSGDSQSLSYILSIQPTASVGLIAHLSKQAIDNALTLKSENNYVRVDAFNNDNDTFGWDDDWSDEVLQYASSKNIPIKVGSAYNEEQLKRWAKVVQIVEVAWVQYPYDVLYNSYIE